MYPILTTIHHRVNFLIFWDGIRIRIPKCVRKFTEVAIRHSSKMRNFGLYIPVYSATSQQYRLQNTRFPWSESLE